MLADMELALKEVRLFSKRSLTTQYEFKLDNISHYSAETLAAMQAIEEADSAEAANIDVPMPSLMHRKAQGSFRVTDLGGLFVAQLDLQGLWSNIWNVWAGLTEIEKFRRAQVLTPNIQTITDVNSHQPTGNYVSFYSLDQTGGRWSIHAQKSTPSITSRLLLVIGK